MNIFITVTIIWFILLILAFINGALREIIMIKVLGINKLLAHQISCATGIILWTAFLYLIWHKIGVNSYEMASVIGAYWFLLTVLIETFLINKLMNKMSWQQIIQTYDVTKGQLWGLVLIYVGLLPIVILFFKRNS